MSTNNATVSRRAFVQWVGLATAAAACGGADTGAAADGGVDTGGTDSGGGADSGGGTDTGADTGADTGSDTGAAAAWATGGTAAMVAQASYPNPFEGASATTCTVTCGATIGPCHTTSPERQDVSNGLDGLPVRLEVRIVDEDCNPVQDAIVEIWHANTEGVYSGEIAAMCNDTAEDRADDFHRGYQRTDSDGRVKFDTCYPGWYGGRAVHIHLRVMTGAYNAADNAAAEVITQLFFADSLNSEIFGGEPVYSEYGEPDTTNETDNVVGGTADKSPYICDVARMSDGAMQASKTIILRTTSAACDM